MNAITSLDVSVEGTTWEQAIRSVNAWRGNALQCFAQSEATVSETLLALAAVPGRGDKVRLRRLVGQRFEDLCCAIGDAGPFAEEGEKAASALESFRQHEGLRPLLCHGIAKVTLDRQGHWLVVFKLLTFRGREPERSSMAIEQHDAAALLADLRGRSRKLGSALGSLRVVLKL
jgi:hypothetical protein